MGERGRHAEGLNCGKTRMYNSLDHKLTIIPEARKFFLSCFLISFGQTEEEKERREEEKRERDAQPLDLDSKCQDG